MIRRVATLFTAAVAVVAFQPAAAQFVQRPPRATLDCAIEGGTVVVITNRTNSAVPAGSLIRYEVVLSPGNTVERRSRRITSPIPVGGSLERPTSSAVSCTASAEAPFVLGGP